LQYRDEAYARFAAEFDHLPLFFPIQKVVVVLHRDKLRPAVLLRRELHRGELIGPHRRSAQVPNFAALDQVMKCFHGLFNRYTGVESVDLEEVDIVSLKASQRSINSGEDSLSG